MRNAKELYQEITKRTKRLLAAICIIFALQAIPTVLQWMEPANAELYLRANLVITIFSFVLLVFSIALAIQSVDFTRDARNRNKTLLDTYMKLCEKTKTEPSEEVLLNNYGTTRNFII